jgi:hypothetical protein
VGSYIRQFIYIRILGLHVIQRSWNIQNLHGKVTVGWILGKESGKVLTGCIWAEDREQWRALVYTLMNLWGDFSIS